MEAIVKPLRKYYANIDIRRLEIKAIFDLIKKHSGQTTIETERFTFIDWEEFEKHIHHLDTLTLKSSGENRQVNCVVSIYSLSVCLDCSWGNIEKNAALFHSIDSIINPLVVKKKWYFSFPIIILLLLVELLLCFKQHFPFNISVTVVNSINVPITLYFLCWIIFSTNRNKISMVDSGHRNFWKRKGEDVIINVVIAVVFFVLGWLIKQ